MIKPFASRPRDTRNDFSWPDKEKRIRKQEFRCVGYKRKCSKKLFVKYLKGKNRYSLDDNAVEIAEFDHKRSSKGLATNEDNRFSNCQALCPACHKRKSSADQASPKRRKNMKDGQEVRQARKLQSKAQARKEVDKYTFRLGEI